MTKRSSVYSIWTSTLLFSIFFLSISSIALGQNTISRFAATGRDHAAETGEVLPVGALDAWIDHPYGVTFDCSGNVYITEQEINDILKVTPGGSLFVISGHPLSDNNPDDPHPLEFWPNTPCGDECQPTGYFGDPGPAQVVPFNFNTAVKYGLPSSTVYDGTLNNLYIADPKNNRLRVIHDPGGASPTLDYVHGSENLLLFDPSHPIIELNDPSNPSGTVEPLCGEVMLGSGIAVDGQGNIYITDNGHHQVVKLPPGGCNACSPTVIAGNGSAGFSGDGNSALSATLNRPMGVTVDKDGNVYIADYFNNRVRKVTVATGIITTLAGNGIAGFSGDGGSATSAELNHPISVAVDDAYRVYIADLRNNRIRVVDQNTGTICTVVGDGRICTQCPFISLDNVANANFTQDLGDGHNATAAQIWFPTEIRVDAWGNLFIVSQNHNQIRFVCQPQSSCTDAPQFSVSISSQPNGPVCAGTSVTFTANTLFAGCNPTYQWKVNGNNAGSNSNTFTYAPANNDVVTCLVTRAASPYSGTGNCCQATTITSNAITMTVNPVPAAIIAGNAILCSHMCDQVVITGTPNCIVTYFDPVANQNQTVTLDATGNANFILCPPANNTQNVVVYTVTLLSITDPQTGCSQNLNVLPITIEVAPDDIHAEFSTLTGNVILCSGSEGCIAVTGTPLATVSYSFSNAGSGTIVLDANGNGCIPVTAPVVTIGYSFTCTLTGVTLFGCPGTANATIGVSVFPLPTATVDVVGPDHICSGDCSYIQFTGTSGAIVTYYDPGAQQNATVTIPPSGFIIIQVCPPPFNGPAPVPYAYTLLSVMDPVSHCSQSLIDKAIITVAPVISAQLSGSITLCSGSSGCIPVTGTPNAVVSYSFSIAGSGTVTLDANGNGCIPVTAPVVNTGFSYTCTLTGVTDYGCTGTVSGTAGITVNPSPTATMAIIGYSSICSGQCTYIQFTGTPGAIVTYYDPFAQQNQDITIPANGFTIIQICPPPFNGPAPQNFTYNLVSVTDPPSRCSAASSIRLTITVAPQLFANIGTINLCSGASGCIPVTGTPGAVVSYDMGAYGSGTITLDNQGNGCVPITAPVVNVGFSISCTLTNISAFNCSATINSTGGATVTPIPNATMAIIGYSTICEGDCSYIQFTGTPGSVVRYFDPISGQNQNITIPNTGFYVLTVCPPSVGSYTFALLGVADPVSHCGKTLNQRAKIIVQQCDPHKDNPNNGVTGGVPFVENIENDQQVALYPNPTNGTFTLELNGIEGNAEVYITDIYGKQIEKRHLENIEGQRFHFDLADKAKGIYMIRVEASNGTFNKKITLQ